MLHLCFNYALLVRFLCFTLKIEAGMRLRMRLADSIRAEPDALHMLTLLMALHMLTMLYLCFAFWLILKQACG